MKKRIIIAGIVLVIMMLCFAGCTQADGGAEGGDKKTIQSMKEQVIDGVWVATNDNVLTVEGDKAIFEDVYWGRVYNCDVDRENEVVTFKYDNGDVEKYGYDFVQDRLILTLMVDGKEGEVIAFSRQTENEGEKETTKSDKESDE